MRADSLKYQLRPSVVDRLPWARARARAQMSLVNVTSFPGCKAGMSSETHTPHVRLVHLAVAFGLAAVPEINLIMSRERLAATATATMTATAMSILTTPLPTSSVRRIHQSGPHSARLRARLQRQRRDSLATSPRPLTCLRPFPGRSSWPGRESCRRGRQQSLRRRSWWCCRCDGCFCVRKCRE